MIVEVTLVYRFEYTNRKKKSYTKDYNSFRMDGKRIWYGMVWGGVDGMVYEWVEPKHL